MKHKRPAPIASAHLTQDNIYVTQDNIYVINPPAIKNERHPELARLKVCNLA